MILSANDDAGIVSFPKVPLDKSVPLTKPVPFIDPVPFIKPVSLEAVKLEPVKLEPVKLEPVMLLRVPSGKGLTMNGATPVLLEIEILMFKSEELNEAVSLRPVRFARVP